MSENLNKKVAKLQELREGLKAFAEANPFSEMTAEIKSEWAERNNEVEELAEAVKSLQVMEKQQADNDAELEKGAEVKTLPIHNEVEKEAPKGLSAQIRESKAYNAFMDEGMLNISSEIKYNPFLETKTLVDEAQLIHHRL